MLCNILPCGLISLRLTRPLCCNRGHLDIQINLLTVPSATRGILGSTIGAPLADAESSDHTFYDAGHEADYAVSSLFEGLPSLPLQTATISRRHLLGVSDVFVPISAGSTSHY